MRLPVAKTFVHPNCLVIHCATNDGRSYTLFSSVAWAPEIFLVSVRYLGDYMRTMVDELSTLDFSPHNSRLALFLCTQWMPQSEGLSQSSPSQDNNH